MAMVHGIVEDHGGAITLESEVGVGTTFHIFLPLIEKKVSLEAETVRPVPGGNEKILFVDDELALVEAMQGMLERFGYEVAVRTSSVEALKAFAGVPGSFDLVITDMTMPNMTGVELAKELMKIRPDIPIILCTGFSELVNEEKAKKLGIRALVMKPVIMAEMAKTIREVLEQH